MGNTRIEWTKKTWNPVTGCTKISPGCQNCYAERMAKRLRGRCGYDAENPFKVTLHPDRLEEPLHWRKPSTVFVCSMGDLFHEDVPFEFITQVFDEMCSWRWPNKEVERNGDESLLEDPGHTFQVLTKRPERIDKWLNWVDEFWPGSSPLNVNREVLGHLGNNIWLGVTVENQEQADKRIPILLQTPAAVRFVSVEPMLGPVDLTNIKFDRWTTSNVLEGCGVKTGPGYVGQSIPNFHCEKINWVICGGETGPGARPMHPDWVRSLRDQCQAAGISFFLKSWGEYCFPSQMPEETYQALQDRYNLDVEIPWKVGKKAAGRILDGRTWEEMPEAQP